MIVIKYKTFEELKEAILNVSADISRAIIDGVKENKDKKEKYRVISLYAEDAETYIDVDLDPKDIGGCLDDNLRIMEREEDFVKCLEVLELKKYFNLN